MSWCREAAACALAAAALNGQAADWTLGGSLGARLERLQNLELLVPPAPDAWRLVFPAELELRGRTELWSVDVAGSLSPKASDVERYENTDGSFDFSLARRLERGALQASAGWLRDSTLASELETTGVPVTYAQRDSYRADVGLEHALSERWSAQAGLSASAISYLRPEEFVGLYDSDTYGVNGSLAYAWSARTTFGVAASESHTDTDPFSYRSRTRALQATATHAFSETLSLSAAIGPAQTRIDTAPLVLVCPAPIEFCLSGLVPFVLQTVATSSTSTARTYDVSVGWLAGPRTTATFSATRGQRPSGAGFLTDTIGLTARLAHRLREHLLLDLEAAFTDAERAGGTSVTHTFTERYRAVLAWRFAEEWTAEAEARLLATEVPGGAQPHSETFVLGVRWRPRERRL